MIDIELRDAREPGRHSTTALGERPFLVSLRLGPAMLSPAEGKERHQQGQGECVRDQYAE